MVLFLVHLAQGWWRDGLNKRLDWIHRQLWLVVVGRRHEWWVGSRCSSSERVLRLLITLKLGLVLHFCIQISLTTAKYTAVKGFFGFTMLNRIDQNWCLDQLHSSFWFLTVRIFYSFRFIPCSNPSRVGIFFQSHRIRTPRTDQRLLNDPDLHD